MIRAVIFDMDGVLIDTEKYYTKYWAEAGQMLGFPMERNMDYFSEAIRGSFADRFWRICLARCLIMMLCAICEKS